MLSTKGKKVKNPELFNRNIYQGKEKHGGCIDTLACTNCGTLVTDSLCLCVGVFICPECGYDNQPKYMIGTISEKPKDDEDEKIKELFEEIANLCYDFDPYECNFPDHYKKDPKDDDLIGDKLVKVVKNWLLKEGYKTSMISTN